MKNKAEMWDHKTDELPHLHPLAYKQVSCDECGVLVHAFNNENMCEWVECDDWNVCLKCLIRAARKEFNREN